jgi:UDP-N-acetylglucosamine acyltransferase
VTIHATAIVEGGARIAENVTIGPYCAIGPHVTLGEGVELTSHVVVTGHTQIGTGTRIWPFASIGHQPQDLKYRGEKSFLEIGANCMIRENVTVNTGTDGGGLYTRVGANCLLMAGCHVAHDCQIGINTVLANNVILAGHVEIGEFSILGGMTAVHQFVRIGAFAMVGGMSGVNKDVIPYGSVIGNRAELRGLNMVGLKRSDVDRDTIQALWGAYRMIFADGGALVERAARASETYPDVAPVQRISEFIGAGSKRNFCTPRNR